jgi:hypothetical protein
MLLLAAEAVQVRFTAEQHRTTSSFMVLLHQPFPSNVFEMT